VSWGPSPRRWSWPGVGAPRRSTPRPSSSPRTYTTSGGVLCSPATRATTTFSRASSAAAEGLEPCVELARRHAIYTVLDPELAPRTAEEKLVYVADRRGGQGVEALEERARDTARRNPKYSGEIERAIPLAKAIEREVFGRCVVRTR